MPHVGTELPPEVALTLSDTGLKVGDTDWRIERLYDFLEATDAAVLQAIYSRTVIDLNRSPTSEPLYPGRFETGLLPTVTFDGEPLYKPGQEPDATEQARRLDAYWRPYHARLEAALDEARARHGYALLLDAHSIRARIPALFEGRLPDVNVGTADGASASPDLTAALERVLKAQDRFSWVVNGRFKGGWTTRHYGRPAERVHAVQFELVQAAYLEEANPSVFDPERAAPMRDLLVRLIGEIRNFAG
jgi:N-formylglutamate deformylase